MLSQARRFVGPMTRTVVDKVYLKPSLVRHFNRRALKPWASSEVSPMEEFMRDVDRQFAQMERQMDSMLRNVGWTRPLLGMRPSVESELISEGSPSKYTLHVDLGEGVDPENVKLSLKDRLLTIEAKAEHKSEDGNSRLYQEITRKITLPETIDPKDVKSLLAPDGRLVIEAALPQQEAQKPKEIPIHTQTETPQVS